MKLIKQILIILLFLTLLSCSKCSKDKEPSNNEFLKFTNEINEVYDSNKVTKEIIDYVYDKPEDIFWEKAIYKDSAGTIKKTIDREFDNDRFPIKETITEGGTITEISEIKYSHTNYELLSLVAYNRSINESSKLRSKKYIYDNEGYLISQEVTIFSSNPNFKNVDGNNIVQSYTLRFFPKTTSKPKGNQIITYFIEKNKEYFDGSISENSKEQPKYKIGDISQLEETQFDEEGIPTHYKAIRPSEPDKPTEEWYKPEKDGLGNIVSLTSFPDSTFETNNEKSIEINLEYDDQGIISKIEEFKFNPETKKFDIFHDLKSFIWNDPMIKSVHNYIEASYKNEHKCYHKKVYTINETRIEKFSDGEKIVTKFSASYPNDRIPQNPEPKLKRKSIIKYQKIEKK